MKDIKLKLDKYEFGIIINALVEYRNKLIKDGEDIEYVNGLLLKLLDKN